MEKPEQDTEILQTQLNATFWEMNYCKQRITVLEIQGNKLHKQIESINTEKEKKDPNGNYEGKVIDE